MLIVGILLLFYSPVYGGILVGIVAGIYFGDEVVAYIRNWTTYIKTSHGYGAVARHLISAGIAIAFLSALRLSFWVRLFPLESSNYLWALIIPMLDGINKSVIDNG